MEDAKKVLKEMMDRRMAIEEEIDACLARLEAPGGGGRTGSLIDSEVDSTPSRNQSSDVRTDRNRIAVLTNDHKALSDQIQKALEDLHLRARTENQSSSSASTSAPVTSSPPKYYPFAYVESVSEKSPALAAGIEVGDQLCQFGEIQGTRIKNPNMLSRLAAALKANEGKEVETKFLRNGQLRTMILVPKKWGGPGLIGCYLKPLD